MTTKVSTTEEKDDDKKAKDDHFGYYYAMLSHQQNMMTDSVRTGTYQRAMLENRHDFTDKVVLDVGTGSGLLAFFAVQAGARKVYAVEASKIAESAVKLVEANGMADRIVVLQGKIEELELPEKVDIIISEPMGFLLVHERMLESYVWARQKWLKPGGKMFPTTGTMFFVPFTDPTVYQEQMAKSEFWNTKEFYGIDLSVLKETSRKQYFSQAIVGYLNPDIFIADHNAPVTHKIDFLAETGPGLLGFKVPFSFVITKTSIMHGLACWFDVSFDGSESVVVLSTSPMKPGTHWYQCLLLLSEPLAVNASQVISGELVFTANERFSHDVELTVTLDGTKIQSQNVIALHDQDYRYLSNPTAAYAYEDPR